jgi:hypothetical protein
LEIVQTLAERGSQNHQLLLDLVAAGGHLMGTEDPGLLLEEYHQLKNGLRGGRRQNQDGVMTNRDEYMARRINETLQEGEIGILFIGAMHQVYERLPRDIEVSYLLPELKRNDGARERQEPEVGCA